MSSASPHAAPIRLQLPSGLTVLLKPQHGAPVVAMQAWVNVGSADESEEMAGVSHVFEHMLFKGTRRRGVGAIAREVESGGGEINAWTSFDQTVFHLVMASRFFDAGIDILTDALRASSFDPGELARELKVVLEEVKQGEDSPGRVASQQLFGAAYRRHTYGRPVIGYARTVEQFRRADLLAVFRQYYVPNNITFVVVGDFDPGHAERVIARAWKGARPRPLPSRVRPVEPPQRATRVALRGGEVSEVHLVAGFHIPGLRDPDIAALDLAAIVLGQGDSSRLQADLKRSRQLVTDTWAYAFTPRDPGLFVVGATLPPDRLHEAALALPEEAMRLAARDIDAAELDKARAIIESDLVFGKETVQGLARKLGFFETVAGSLSVEEEYFQQIRQATVATVREAVARHARPANFTLSVVLPAASPGLATSRSRRELSARLAGSVEEAARRAFAGSAGRGRRGGAREEKKVVTGARQPVRADVVTERLSSGARLIVLRDPTVPLVAMRAAWVGGLRAESAAESGLSNLCSSLVTRGTASRSGDAIAREMEALAGSLGGFSGRNSFGLRAEVMSRHLEHGLSVLAECALAPTFPDEEVAREKRQALEELRTQEDNVTQVTFQLLARALWPRHPYRLDLLGTPDTVRALDRDHLARHHARWYRPSQMVLALCGDVEPREAVRLAERCFPPAAGDAAPPPITQAGPALDEPPAAARVRRRMQKQQAHLAIGFPGARLSDADRFPLEILATILSGQGGRLFVELREKRGLAYRVSAFTLEGLDPGYFAVYVATSPERLAEAEARILVELSRLRDRQVPRAELLRAQRYLAGSHDISLQRRATMAASLAFNEAYGLGWDAYARYAGSILAVTPAALQDAARRYLDPARAITAIVSPDEEPASARPEPPDEIARAARAPER